MPLASGVRLVPGAWRGQRACFAATNLLELAGGWNIICVRSLLEILSSGMVSSDSQYVCKSILGVQY